MIEWRYSWDVQVYTVQMVMCEIIPIPLKFLSELVHCVFVFSGNSVLIPQAAAATFRNDFSCFKVPLWGIYMALAIHWRFFRKSIKKQVKK